MVNTSLLNLKLMSSKLSASSAFGTQRLTEFKLEQYKKVARKYILLESLDVDVKVNAAIS